MAQICSSYYSDKYFAYMELMDKDKTTVDLVTIFDSVNLVVVVVVFNEG